MKIALSDLEMAFDYASSGAEFSSEAYLNLETGEFIYLGEGSDEEEPDDLHIGEKYIGIPTVQEFDLGRNLAIKFTREHMPQEIDKVYSFFSSRGAYSRFKGFLENCGHLEKWYTYENQATKEALLEWCEENDIVCDT